MRLLIADKVLVLRTGCDKVFLFRGRSLYRQVGNWIPAPTHLPRWDEVELVRDRDESDVW